MVCSWFRDAAGWMLGSVTWIFSLGSVLGGSSSVCFCSVPWLFGPGGVVERKSFLSAFWPVAAKALDAATRKSALSKNLRFLLILDFSRISSSVPKMCLSWVHISSHNAYQLINNISYQYHKPSHFIFTSRDCQMKIVATVHPKIS